MPPYYDIYGLSKQRDRKTIETFLSQFCFRDKVENRQGQEVNVRGMKKYNVDETSTPITTLTEVIEYGLKNLNHGFSFYISDNLKPGVDEIILKFTYDGKIIFGVSIEETRIAPDGKLVDNFQYARELEQKIYELTNSRTSIQFEYAPSDDEDEFERDVEFWKKMNEDKGIR